MTPLALAGLCLAAALILAGLGLAVGMGKIRDARRYLDSATPLYDRTVDELGFTPERPFSPGDETDVVEALRTVEYQLLTEEPDPEVIERIRLRVVDEVRRGGYVRGDAG